MKEILLSTNTFAIVMMSFLCLMAYLNKHDDDGDDK